MWKKFYLNILWVEKNDIYCVYNLTFIAIEEINATIKLLCIYHSFDVECKLELTLTTDYSDFDDTKVSNLLHTDNSSIACARSRNYSLSLGPPKRWVCVVEQPCAGILKLGSMALKLGAGESGIRDKNVKWTH